MALPSSFQFQDSTENHIAFSRILRSSPTAAIDHYRTLYASRKRWSATDKPYFIAATQIFGATLTYKDWETNVFPDSPAISRGDLLNGFTVGVDSINGDIWKAIVSTELPLLWLDSCLKQNPVHDLVRARFFSTSTYGLNVECRYLRRCSNVSSRLHTYGRKNSVKGPKTIAMAYLPHSLAPTSRSSTTCTRFYGRVRNGSHRMCSSICSAGPRATLYTYIHACKCQLAVCVRFWH